MQRGRPAPFMGHDNGNHSIRRLLEAGDALPLWVRAVAAVAVLFIVATADWYTEYEVAFAAVYVLPVAAMAWFVGTRSGAMMSLAGTILWFSLNFPVEHGSTRIVGAWNFTLRLAMLLFVSVVVGGARDLLETERERSRTDGLTAVLNARAFYEAMQREIARTRRYHRPLSIAYLDLDDFKVINDRMGHAAGDDLLRRFAFCIKRTMRSIDTVGRLGGDEFVVLMPETGTEGAVGAVHRLTENAGTPEELPVSVSIGILTCDDPVPESIDEIIQRADTLMYTAKRLGKHRFIQGRFSDVAPLPTRETAEAHSG